MLVTCTDDILSPKNPHTKLVSQNNLNAFGLNLLLLWFYVTVLMIPSFSGWQQRDRIQSAAVVTDSTLEGINDTLD